MLLSLTDYFQRADTSICLKKFNLPSAFPENLMLQWFNLLLKGKYHMLLTSASISFNLKKETMNKLIKKNKAKEKKLICTNEHN